MGNWSIIMAGTVTGLLGSVLVVLGNPPNMGVCVVCFIRDISGALGFHRAAAVQYLRPEIMGFILGSFVIASANKEVRARGGSSPALRFFIALGVAIGALVFLGCPLRMVLRLAAGDLNALVGLAGFAGGVLLGVQFLRTGFTLGRSHQLQRSAAYVAPAFAVGLLALLLARPGFVFFTEKGPGALYAPVLLSLAAGLLVGAVAQRTRLCMMGGVRDAVLIRDFHLVAGFISIFLFALVANLLFGKFTPGFSGQPIAHSDGLYNFMGMAAVGLGSVMLGGCPLRQLIMAGEGDQDALSAVLGLLVGAALAHNFGLAASATGVPAAGQVAVWIVLSLMTLTALLFRESVSSGAVRKTSIGVGVTK